MTGVGMGGGISGGRGTGDGGDELMTGGVVGAGQVGPAGACGVAGCPAVGALTEPQGESSAGDPSSTGVEPAVMAVLFWFASRPDGAPTTL
jgi:hypothetical protein